MHKVIKDNILDVVAILMEPLTLDHGCNKADILSTAVHNVGHSAFFDMEIWVLGFFQAVIIMDFDFALLVVILLIAHEVVHDDMLDFVAGAVKILTFDLDINPAFIFTSAEVAPVGHVAHGDLKIASFILGILKAVFFLVPGVALEIHALLT